MNRKLNISYYTAKKMLMELLANDKLLEDEEIKKILKKMALQSGKTNICIKKNTYYHRYTMSFILSYVQ